MKTFAKTFYIALILISGAALIPVLGVQGRTFRWQNYAGLYETPTPATFTLLINHSHGAPGSFFTVTGFGLPPNTATSVFANGVQVASNIITNDVGEIAFQLNTSNASFGLYEVTISIATSAPGSSSIAFSLIPNGVIHPPTGNGSIINVPPGISVIQRFLPVTIR